ncbi:hypothetical protein HPB50_018606 [Hyalomma asiaticum]|uniref:Uncharacterized protein n=1 Tax=Hyalomma asiaticum TaxID=266040 RepID=A0ACB7SII5_HYAAI|nr:hypothetical protein HPB50_018606 [Hyalomma asiaticum]
MRRQQRTIYYLDETWVNAGHTEETVWTDTKVMSRQDAFRQDLSTGLRAPSGKGGRLIVLHAGSAEGFLDGAALVFRAKKGARSARTSNGFTSGRSGAVLRVAIAAVASAAVVFRVSASGDVPRSPGSCKSISSGNGTLDEASRSSMTTFDTF